jgi:hypothetical protein
MQIGTYRTYLLQSLLRYVYTFLEMGTDYAFAKNTSHRVFSALSLSLCFVMIGLFVAYGYVMKMGIETSFLYESTRYSFVDGGYPEILGYFFEIFTVALFTAYAIAHKSYSWLAWAAIFAVTFLDDCLSLRDGVGHAVLVAKGLGAAPYELTGMLIISPFILVIWIAGFYKSFKQPVQTMPYLLFSAYYGMLMFFGVVVDIAHGFLSHKYDISETAVVLVEDGSELLILCLIAISALGMWCVNKHKLNWQP